MPSRDGSEEISVSDLAYDSTGTTLMTPKGQLHYHLAGEGPPVLLLHGSGPGVSGSAERAAHPRPGSGPGVGARRPPWTVGGQPARRRPLLGAADRLSALRTTPI